MDATDALAAFRAELADAEGHRGGEGATPASFVDDDGTAYAWDVALGRFVAVREESLEGGFVTQDDDASHMTFVDDDDDARARLDALAAFEEINARRVAIESEDGGTKAAKEARKRESALARAAAKAKRAREEREKENAGAFERGRAKSSAVYVTGLPSDCTETELFETFKKCGVVKLDSRTAKPRVKLYSGEDGKLKGDGLVVFLKAPSVDLAISLLDQAELRPGDASTVMTVTAASFEQKEDKDESRGAKAPRKGMSKEERKRAAAMLRRQEADALGWSGFDDEIDKKKLIVVLRHMFKLEEMYADAGLRKELEEDVMEEARRTCGPVESVKTYTTSKDGTMTICFKSIEAADACVTAWNGRWFDGRQIAASIWDGKSKFVSEESEAAQKERLDNFVRELGGGDEDEDSEEEDEEEEEEEEEEE